MKIVEYNSIIYVMGENAKDNRDILDLYKNEDDKYICFHLNCFSSAYVIMLSTINNINKSKLYNHLYYGAELCKNNTKYRNFKNLKIIYTTLNKLLKADTIGKVIIPGKFNTLTV